MITLYYDYVFALSLVLALTYFCIWHKHFDMHITLIFVFIPIANLGHVMLYNAATLEAALEAVKITYIGGTFNILLIMFAGFSLLDIKIPRWLKIFFILFTSLLYLSSLTVGSSPIFYKGFYFSRVNGIVSIRKEYGPMHTVFYGMLIVYLLISLSSIIYSYFKKRQISRKMIYLLVIPELVCFVAFFGGRMTIEGIELLPLAYDFAMIVYLVIIYRICLYDITDTAIDSIVQSGDTGFASFDFKYNYLGSNDTAKIILPELNELTVDKSITKNDKISKTILQWLKSFDDDNSSDTVNYKTEDKSYLVEINYLFDGRRKRGYQLFFKDDTKNQQYKDLINRYNTYLRKEVAQKTAHIVEMHDNLVMSMATMVESRDNSTGGHIKRTSEVVRMLVDEINKDDSLILTHDFCKNIIKAAPMHDLGKIAVDDAILRKPGRFTDEEFEIMKTHAAEGARIVHEILKGTDDLEFHHIAENVAHYHHERWDGSGYPEGLKGEEIPLEARIMAIADVYDALVSKRVYKEKMSFEQADKIIMEGMGKHFDKSLEKYYVGARPNLEAYYSSLEQ